MVILRADLAGPKNPGRGVRHCMRTIGVSSDREVDSLRLPLRAGFRSQKTLAQNDQRFLLSLPQTIVAGGDEVEEAEVAEDLQLLADFVANVAILGMNPCQCISVGVYVGESKFGFA